MQDMVLSRVLNSQRHKKNTPNLSYTEGTCGKTLVGKSGLESQMLMPMASEGTWRIGQLYSSFQSPLDLVIGREYRKHPTGSWLSPSRHLPCSGKHSFAFCSVKQAHNTAIAHSIRINSGSTILRPSPKLQHQGSCHLETGFPKVQV
jgi:hypothetical protein